MHSLSACTAKVFHSITTKPFTNSHAGGAFAPNAQRAMSLLDPKIREGYEWRATRNASKAKDKTSSGFQMGMDGRGDVASYKAGDMIAKVVSGGQSSVHRAHFLDEMVKLFPKGNVTFGKWLVNVDHNGSQNVTLRFGGQHYSTGECGHWL